MKKKIILVCIVALPSLTYLFFELSKANFKKMFYYGPKTVNAKGDTNYYVVPEFFKTYSLEKPQGDSLSTNSFKVEAVKLDTSEFPVYAIVFMQEKTKDKAYMMNGLFDYAQHKSRDLKGIPIFFASNFDKINYLKNSITNFKTGTKSNGLYDSLPIKLPDFRPLQFETTNIDSLLKATYFKEKPVFIMYHFAVLVDRKKHIRGYYDLQFDTEVKRMIQEFQHLKLRDEHVVMEREDKITTDKDEKK